MENWDEIRRWRRERRDELIGRREALPQRARHELQSRILDLLEMRFPELAGGLVGFYWPIRGEIGLHALIRRLVERGAGAALPAVVEKDAPLEFRAWRPGDRLERGFWNISVPAERLLVSPTVLLVPLVGFDRQGFRLGYGGGYYDRTLAALTPRPRAIGVGYELGRLETIHPQAHDVPLDAIVTEAGAFEARARQVGTALPEWDEDPNSTGSFASPPCFMHELDPSGLGLDPTGPADTGVRKLMKIKPRTKPARPNRPEAASDGSDERHACPLAGRRRP